MLIILLITTISCFDKRNEAFTSKVNTKTAGINHQEAIKKKNFDNLENAFSNNLIVNQYYLENEKKVNYSITFINHTIGVIRITSGKIVACDGFVSYGSEPFKYDFPLGEYSVDLAVGKFSYDNDERVGFARIKFSDNQPVRWELALKNGQDITQLKENEIYGYGVDSGTGCFMDIEGKNEFDLFLNPTDNLEYDKNSDVILKELEKSDKPTWTHLIWERNGKNVVIFSSGVGDGFYATYIGYDAKNQICRLVTDFDLIIQ